jgi:membrane protein YqaA with SNARE-associated domain
MEQYFELGYAALFFACFLAATIIPFSSEAILTAMLVSGYDVVMSLAVATAGNWLGGMTSYYIGIAGKYEWIEKYLRIPHSRTEKFKQIVAGKEAWVGFFAWLPFIGDVLAVVLGLLKAPVLKVALGMLAGKALRYIVWGWITIKGINLIF